MKDYRKHELGDLYAQLIHFETMYHPFEQRFQQAVNMRQGFGPFGNIDHHDAHNLQHWSEHFDHHFHGPVRDVLETIKDNPNINARTISEKTDILPGTLSKYLKRMIGRHLVAEQTNPDNRREKFYSLTDGGNWLLSVAHGVQEDDQQSKNDIFEEFTEDEQDVIVRFLVAMRHRDDQTDDDQKKPS
ncbi:MarR family winged helix-turn-helix transcriptional regulator [Furfurilactobacillus siliginis]|uniref:HTH marR-type domain-containing protein n=1 Tax=Furfurilactobacillus siliginis TaxID=348151 RepID=A0A0R2LDP4_9LACO|nr:winged helix DNA-binding protein [Furfurilactobacillus siliginis]KRN97162.1 hypothetical protein IV55_GL000081 [Furfurilactobacillus siliginis]GEK29519.1 hypothetical protein LSI01_18300 [Furfurilactobacillus siliginis]